MNDPEVTPPKIAKTLSRDLSLLHITMMGVGMTIAAGVFLGIGNTIAIAGPGVVILTFALNGIVALFTAILYAELSLNSFESTFGKIPIVFIILT